TEEYEYDDTDQITVASGWRNESYTYDKNGNRSNYTIGDDNQILSDGDFNYDYDDEGNMTLKTEISSGDYWTYEWDYRNRLTKVTKYNIGNVVQEVSDFTYDVFNRLVIRSFDDDGPGGNDPEILKTAYNGVHPLADFAGNDDLKTSYMYGPV